MQCAKICNAQKYAMRKNAMRKNMQCAKNII